MSRPPSYPSSCLGPAILGKPGIPMALTAPQVILVGSQLWGPVLQSRRRGAYTPQDGPATNDITDINEQDNEWHHLKSVSKEGYHFRLTQRKDYGLNEQKVLKTYLYTESQTFLSKLCQHMLNFNHQDVSSGYLLIMDGLGWWNSGLRFFLSGFPSHSGCPGSFGLLLVFVSLEA